MEQIANNLVQVRHEINQLIKTYQRNPAEVILLAVSKTKSVAQIQQAVINGQYRFGENYLQEALPKIQQLSSYKLQWHFIGQIQSNKTRDIATHFDWVQSLHNIKHARRLSQQRATHLPPLQVTIQINSDNEPQKAGVALEEALDFAHEVAALPQLRLRGIMGLPAPSDDFEQQRHKLQVLHALYQKIQQQIMGIDTLSMGMSKDMAAAIAEGSTLLRIGSAIFGARATHNG